MDNNAVLRLLEQVMPKEQILADEPMKNHTSFKIGGNADFMVLPKKTEEISGLIKILTDVPYYIMGNGSNLLVKDEGYRGVIIKICEKFNDVQVNGHEITAQSGALLSRIANIAAANSLGGFEFASGIPGTIGGAVLMNAGAYDGEMKDVVERTQYIDDLGEIWETTEHEFSYRHSIFSDKNYIITKCTIKLGPKDQQDIKALMADLTKRRRDKQPLNMPSAGSTFKRPDGYYASKLIDDAGLRGFAIGGAQVSEKHCGFVVNKGGATYNDVMQLIDHIREKVYAQFGVELELEVKILE